MGVGILGLKTTKSAHLIFGYSNKIDAVMDEKSFPTLIVTSLGAASTTELYQHGIPGTVSFGESSHAVRWSELYSA
jgi:hypothetical protein